FAVAAQVSRVGGRRHGRASRECAIGARATGYAKVYAPALPTRRTPMGLTTHVLDTMHGTPAAGMAVLLFRVEAQGATLLRPLAPGMAGSLLRVGAQGARLLLQLLLDADGRAAAPLLPQAEMRAGRYRLVFAVAAYFRGRGAALPQPPFRDEVPVEFGIADAAA